MTVSDPSHLFSSRAGVALEKMSLLELMCELDKRHWVKKDGAKNVRRLDPFDVVNQEPTTWYCKKGFLPCKEYLLALLSGNAMGLKKVYHLQCKAYYQCLAIKPDVVPHQVAQFYKAFLARRRRFGEPESEPASASSNQLEPDDALMVLSKKTGSTSSAPKAAHRTEATRKQRGPGLGTIQILDSSSEHEPDSDAISGTEGAEGEQDDDILNDFLDVDGNNELAHESQVQQQPKPCPRKKARTVTGAVEISEPKQEHPGKRRRAIESGESAELCVEETPGPSGPSSGSAEAALATEAAEAEVAAPAAGSADPVFVPKVRASEGHRNVCNYLLPVLLEVLREQLWWNRNMRTQIREALDSGLFALVM